MSDPLEKARDAKAKVARQREQTTAERVEEILQDDRVNPELKRKLRYCQDQLQRRRGDSTLLNVRKDLLRQVARML